MSLKPGDFNNDGRSDYVDYKIYTTQIDPNSGEYEGPTTGGDGGKYIVWIIFAGIGLFLLSLIASKISIFAPYLYALALIIAFRWKGLDTRNYPINNPYNIVLAFVPIIIAIFVVYRFSSNLSYYVSNSSRYINKADYWVDFLRTYSPSLIGAVILVFAFLSKNVIFTVIGLATFLSPFLSSVVSIIIRYIDQGNTRGFGDDKLHFISLLAYFLLMAGFRRPWKRPYIILAIVLSLFHPIVLFFLYRAFYINELNPYIVLVFFTALFLLLSNPKEQPE